jgi:hypothetical protein
MYEVRGGFGNSNRGNEYGEHVLGSEKGARGPICLVSRCGDICPLGEVVAAQMLLRSQRR